MPPLEILGFADKMARIETSSWYFAGPVLRYSRSALFKLATPSEPRGRVSLQPGYIGIQECYMKAHIDVPLGVGWARLDWEGTVL